MVFTLRGCLLYTRVFTIYEGVYSIRGCLLYTRMFTLYEGVYYIRGCLLYTRVFTLYEGVYSEGVFCTYEGVAMCLLVHMSVFFKVFKCKTFTIHESVSKLMTVFTVHMSVFQYI